MWLITKSYHSGLLESDGRDGGRDMGEMTGVIMGGMEFLKVLCLKEFREIDGRDERNISN